MFEENTDALYVNNLRVDCLMYADDIVIVSESKEGLQKRLDILQQYCTKWCLNVNLNKTKVLVFNKTGRLIKCPIYYEGKELESVDSYKYLGIQFAASGKFTKCKLDLYKKANKAAFKLQQCLSSTNPSISTLLHLYDHTIKPIIFYDSEIWGMFSPDSASCKKINDYFLEKTFSNDLAEKSHVKFMKYILGVNRKASNIAVMSELGRYPIFFSIILSMLKYCHRLEKLSSGLLYETYICSKNLHLQHVNTWYSRIECILKEINIPNILDFKLGKFCRVVKNALCNSFLAYWYTYKDEVKKTQTGKLVTYFSLKRNFGRETYLSLKEFRNRQAICKLRISAHALKIETDRYNKQYIERSMRICKYCLDQVEDEQHLITNCTLYDTFRDQLFSNLSINYKNFTTLNNKAKFIWLMTNEDLELLKALGFYIQNCFEARK